MEEELIPFGTPQEQLATVNQAIYNILVGGQSYQIGSRRLQEQIWPAYRTCRVNCRPRSHQTNQADYLLIQ